jgi:hypothetical protein
MFSSRFWEATMGGVRQGRRRFTVAVVGMLGVMSCLVPGVPVDAAPVPYSLRPISGFGTSGTGRAVLVVGTTVYVGGSFSATVHPAMGSTRRSNVAAFDLATGAVRHGFVANTNGQVLTLASDGRSLFLGGSFTTVNGQSALRVAAVDLATGRVTRGLSIGADGDVYALAVSGARLYMGGAFLTVGSTSRQHVASVDISTGRLDRSFSPRANSLVRALAVSPDGSRLHMGGRFTTVNGTARLRAATVQTSDGALSSVVYSGSSQEVFDLDVAPDGRSLYGAIGGTTNSVVAWSTGSGARRWSHRAEGDVHTVRASGGNVWFGFHEGFAGDFGVRLLGADATSGALVAFRPRIDSYMGVWAIDATATTLAIVGEFRTVEGLSSRGVAVFTSSVSSPTPTSLIARGATWRYLDDGSDQGTRWRSTSFDDSRWRSGRGQLGYGDGDEATEVRFGPNPSHKYVTTYFRRSFDLVGNPRSLRLQLLRDDGAVVYLNGHEVARTNMPPGPIDSRTLATSATGGENRYRDITIDASFVRSGRNVLAIEVHQASRASSDVGFDAALVG